MATSYSATRTQTSTYSKIIYVTRKVQADFLAILDTYGYFSEDVARGAVNDIRVFLDEEVIDQISFAWRVPGGTRVLDELKYIVVSGIAVKVDDDSGGIGYQVELASADFEVRVHFSQRWRDIGRDGRDNIRERLKCLWGVADSLDYGGGRWVSDRTYSSGGYGLTRERFVR